MNLHELHPAPGSTKSKKRLGRGIGSGQERRQRGEINRNTHGYAPVRRA